MQIQENIALKDKNWFKTAGAARFYCEPETTSDFQTAINFAHEKELEVFVLGCGANLLISDEGFSGLVISTLKFNQLELGIEDESLVKASAGIEIQVLINKCLEKNLIGLEDFSGIPGTVGGSAYINIHYFDKFLSDFIVGATVLDKQTGDIEEVDKEWFEYGYDSSKLMNGKYLLLDLTLKLNKTDAIETAYAKGRSDEIIRQRNSRYPIKNTCGSFFRNFLSEEVNFETNGSKILNVAYYLDKIGVKGDLKVGNAVVSARHANMIETSEGATSSDVINLAVKMQELVKEKYGIVPQPECQLIGFNTNPFSQIA
ncbi:UDP-N-acetylmuramate dehydrogenase [Candidatus Dojkabacteria bacterium]|nr:UDP-N-acetylmuramate dehydrogenase [Candidatus Dojkabacteria bacterium]